MGRYHTVIYSGAHNPAGFYQRVRSAFEEMIGGLERVVSSSLVTPEGIQLPNVMYGRSGGPTKARSKKDWLRNGSKPKPKGSKRGNNKRRKEAEALRKREERKRNQLNPSGNSKYARRVKARKHETQEEPEEPEKVPQENQSNHFDFSWYGL